jgi:hypothetical protein
VISYQVISWFQSLPFKFNMHRYNAAKEGIPMAAYATLNVMSIEMRWSVVGRCNLNSGGDP